MSPLLLVLYSLPDALCQLFGVQRLDETAILAANEAGVVDDAGRTLYLAYQHEDTEKQADKDGCEKDGEKLDDMPEPGRIILHDANSIHSAGNQSYESILLLVLRLLYLQKRESLSASADQVLVTVEEVQAELQKMNLPRRLDQPTLEKLLRTLRRYNLARPVGRLSGLDSRIEVFPTVLLALPDSDLADAAAEVTRTRSELSLYERPEDGTAAVEVEE